MNEETITKYNEFYANYSIKDFAKLLEENKQLKEENKELKNALKNAENRVKLE